MFLLHLLYFGILRSSEWWFLTDVSGQPVGPVFKGHKLPLYAALYPLPPKKKMRRSHLHRGGSQKSHNAVIITWHCNVFVHTSDNTYIKMYSFATKLSLKMTVMGRNT